MSTAVTVCSNLLLFTANNVIFVEVRKGFSALSWIQANGGSRRRGSQRSSVAFRQQGFTTSTGSRKEIPTTCLFMQKGDSSKELVELLEHKLPLFLQDYKNPITVYFWGGTCDITKKQGKYIDIRGKSGDIILTVIRNLHRAKDFVLSHNCRIKELGPQTSKLALLLIKIIKYEIVKSLLHKSLKKSANWEYIPNIHCQ